MLSEKTKKALFDALKSEKSDINYEQLEYAFEVKKDVSKIGETIGEHEFSNFLLAELVNHKVFLKSIQLSRVVGLCINNYLISLIKCPDDADTTYKIFKEEILPEIFNFLEHCKKNLTSDKNDSDKEKMN